MSTIDSVPAQNTHTRWALVTAALLGGVAVLCLPVVSELWGVRDWFVALFLGCSLMLNGLIALFLAMQALAGPPSRMLVWLSAGYAFSSVITAAQFVTFPGLLDQPLGGGAGHVSAWLWVLWHAGFPCFVLLAVGAKFMPPGRPRSDTARQRLLGLIPVAAGVVAGLAGAVVLILVPDLLPVFVEGNDYGQVAGGFVGGALVLLNVFTLGTLASRTRLRELLTVWLALAMFGFTLDTMLSILAAARYNAGWYVARGMNLASSVALMAALLIEHFNMYRAAEIRAMFYEHESLHDTLTGVFNRRHLMQQLAEEIGRAKRYRYPLSVLLLDLDHFKRVNDEFGHAAGDDCLRGLVQALNERGHRQGDFSARYGGEEFVVVLPETGVEGAVDVAEEIRRRVADLHTRGVVPCVLTTSIGVATAHSCASPSAEALLAEADACLYRAKQQGRNCVVSPPGAGPYRMDSAPA